MDHLEKTYEKFKLEYFGKYGIHGCGIHRNPDEIWVYTDEDIHPSLPDEYDRVKVLYRKEHRAIAFGY